jgi:hypothetical protein
MPFEIEFKNGIIESTFSGVVDLSQILTLVQQVEEIEAACDVAPNRICQLAGDMHIAFAFMDMEAVAERRRGTRLKNHVRTALVATAPQHYGYARMFQTLNSNPQIEIRIFNGIVTARRWLNNADSPSEPAKV